MERENADGSKEPKRRTALEAMVMFAWKELPITRTVGSIALYVGFAPEFLSDCSGTG
jgi:hypothetical protein